MTWVALWECGVSLFSKGETKDRWLNPQLAKDKPYLKLDGGKLNLKERSTRHYFNLIKLLWAFAIVITGFTLEKCDCLIFVFCRYKFSCMSM